MFASVFTELGLFLGRGQDGDGPWSPQGPQAPGRDNGPRHLAPPTPASLLPGVGGPCVPTGSTDGRAAPGTPAAGTALGLTGEGQVPARPRSLQVWPQVLPPGLPMAPGPPPRPAPGAGPGYLTSCPTAVAPGRGSRTPSAQAPGRAHAPASQRPSPSQAAHGTHGPRPLPSLRRGRGRKWGGVGEGSGCGRENTQVATSD